MDGAVKVAPICSSSKADLSATLGAADEPSKNMLRIMLPCLSCHFLDNSNGMLGKFDTAMAGAEFRQGWTCRRIALESFLLERDEIQRYYLVLLCYERHCDPYVASLKFTWS